MAELLVITLVILFALTLVILIRGEEGGRLAVYPNIHWHNRQHCSRLPFRLSTGNDVTGPPLSSPLVSSVCYS